MRIVDRRAFEVRGDAPGADPLGDGRAAVGLELTVLEVVIQRAAGRIDQHDSDRRGFRLQEGGDARERAAGPGGRAKYVDLAAGVAPDLRPRRFGMGGAIGGVVELVRPDRVRQLGRQPSRHFLILVRVAVGHGGHLAQLRAQRLDDLVFFGGLVVGHDDDAPVSARVADMGEPDARIARGTLDHRAAGFQHPPPFGIEDDPLGGPVFHGAARIHEFCFTQDLATGFVAQNLEANQRRVADRADESITQSHLQPPLAY